MATPKCDNCNGTALYDRRTARWFCPDCEQYVLPAPRETQAKRNGSRQWEIVTGGRLLSREDARRQATLFLAGGK